MEELQKMLKASAYAKGYLISEYNQLFSELRYINDKIHGYLKLIFTVISSFVVYTLVGTNYVVFGTDNVNVIICLLFSIFGIFAVVFVFYIQYIGLRQYAISKKHRVRYWRSIHAIRKLAIERYPSIRPYVLLPTESRLEDAGGKEKPRPNVSSGEFFTGIFISIVNYLFCGIFFIYFWILFEISVDSAMGRISKSLQELLTSPESQITAAIMTSFVILTGVALLYPHNSLWFYYKNLQAAKVIDNEHLYFSFDIEPSSLFWKDSIWICSGICLLASLGGRILVRQAVIEAFTGFKFVSCLCLAGVLILQWLSFQSRRKKLLHDYAEKYPFLKEDFISDVWRIKKRSS